MEKIKIGVAGLRFGLSMLRDEIAKNDYFQLTAVCDVKEDVATGAGQKYNVKAYTDIDAMLWDDQIQAVGLFTPPGGRAELIRKILKAGKDVVTTKPFERDSEKAAEILAEAEKMGRVVVLNSPSPVLPDNLAKMKEWVTQYDLGRPVGLRIDTYGRRREKADGNWYDNPELCPVAPVFRIGIYCINDALRLFGEAEAISVMQSRLITERPTVDNGQMGIQFKNGAVGTIYATFASINGEEKNIYYENGVIHEKRTDTGSRIWLETLDSQMADEYTPTDLSGGYQWSVFYRLMKGETIDNLVTAKEITNGVKVLEAMAAAAKSKKLEYC